MCGGASQSAFLGSVSPLRIERMSEIVSNFVETLFGKHIFPFGFEIFSIYDRINWLIRRFEVSTTRDPPNAFETK